MSDSFSFATRYAALVTSGKIEADPANPVHLVTVRGLGYKLEG